MRSLPPLFISLAFLFLSYGVGIAGARTGPDFVEAFPDPAVLITTADIEETRELLHTVQLPETDAHHDALLKALDDVEAIDSEHLVLLTEAVAIPPRLTGGAIKSIIKAVIDGREIVYSRGKGEFSHVIDDLLLAGAEKLSDVGPQSFGRLVAAAQTPETIVALSDILLERSDSGSTSDLAAILQAIPWDGTRTELCVEVLIPRGRLKGERADIAIELMSFDSGRTALIGAFYQSLDDLDAETLLRHVRLQSFDSGRTDVAEEGVAVIDSIDGSLAVALVQTNSYDSGREAMLKALLPKLDLRNADEMLALVRTNSYDSGREAMFKALLPKLDRIDGSLAVALVRTNSHDSGRKAMLKALLPKLDLRNADEMLALVRTNSYDSGRLAMLKVAVALESNFPAVSADDLVSYARVGSFDSGRNEMLRVVAPHFKDGFTKQSAARLLRVFSFDSGRLDAVELFREDLQKLSERDRRDILRQFSRASSREEADELLLQ